MPTLKDCARGAAELEHHALQRHRLFTARGKERGLILHTTVGIGYDTPWRQVEAMLLAAADRTDGLEKEPTPFVLQCKLGDFAVEYEINAYCSEPGQDLGYLLRSARAHPGRIQRQRRPDHVAGLRGGCGKAEGSTSGPMEASSNGDSLKYL